MTSFKISLKQKHNNSCNPNDQTLLTTYIIAANKVNSLPSPEAVSGLQCCPEYGEWKLALME